MDIVVQYKDADIPTQIEPTIQAFYPLLQKRKLDIERIKAKTFQYGTTERHKLDIYYPPSASSGKAPVLFYVYGGGYAVGDRQFPAPHSLVYSNVGAFFAEHGYVTVIADYRLLPDAKFPDPVVDIKDAIAFVVEHVAQINDGSQVYVDVDNIFLMGHSAGAAISASLVLLPDLMPSQLRRRIRGIILQSGMYHFDTKIIDVPLQIGPVYYGTPDEIRNNAPLGLLKHASDETVNSLPDIVTTISEFEPPGLLEAHGDFLGVLKARTAKNIDVIVLKGHHHISPYFSLYTGIGEEWAYEYDAWMKARVAA